MTLYGGLSALGALIGAGGTAAIFFTLGIGWIALAVAAGVVLLGYILAAATTNASPKFSEFWRGLLIGFNAGSNGFLVYWLLEMFAPMGVAIGVGAGLGVINFLCSIPKLTQSEFWQGVTGWFNWVFPMSWPIVAFGMLFLILSFILALVTGFKVPYLALQKGRVDWPTGTFFVKSGLFANLNAWDTAFNMVKVVARMV